MLEYHKKMKFFSRTQVNIQIKKGLLLKKKNFKNIFCLEII